NSRASPGRSGPSTRRGHAGRTLRPTKVRRRLPAVRERPGVGEGFPRAVSPQGPQSARTLSGLLSEATCDLAPGPRRRADRDAIERRIRGSDLGTATGGGGNPRPTPRDRRADPSPRPDSAGPYRGDPATPLIGTGTFSTVVSVCARPSSVPPS